MSGFKRATEAFKVTGEFFTGLKDHKKWLEINEEIFKTWQMKELPDIFFSSGMNINDPFPRKKATQNWKPYRKFTAPQRWSEGIWTGETYFALANGKSTKGRRITKRITTRGIFMQLDSEFDLNYTLGVSKDFLEQSEEYAIGEINSLINVLVKNL